MKINIPKKYQFLGSTLLIITIIVIVQIIDSRLASKQKVSITPIISTPSSITYQPSVNPVELTEEWNTQFNKSLEEYSKSDKARIDKNLSSVRKNSPITQPGFKIEYNYSNATYTITIELPTKENREKLFLWLANIDISEKDLNSVRVKWVTAP